MSSSASTVRSLFARFATPAFACCLWLLIVGGKWATFDRYGSAMPDWDQWDAEAANLYAPWFEHDHFFSHLFQAHNEHRIVLTKLQNLAVTLLNGQWDARLEAVVNAMLHATIGVALWLIGRKWVAPFWRPVLYLLIAAMLGVPVAWQNVLGGFHSQQYWLIATSVIAMMVLPFARPWSAAWWGAVAAGWLALVTMGSGFFAALVVLTWVGFRLLRRQTTWREMWPTLAICGAILVTGVLTRASAPWHDSLRGRTAHDWIFTIVHNLQWPVPRDFGLVPALVLWAPWAVLAIRVLGPQPDGATRPVQTVAALGGWVMMQVVATAYARGAGGDFPASRYMDTLVFGMVVNGLALGLLCLPSPNHPAWVRFAFDRDGLIAQARWAGLFVLAWLGVFIWGFLGLIDLTFNGPLDDAKRYYLEAEAHMRGFLATDNLAELRFDNIPYPNADALAERLSHPSVRALQPAVMRVPLPMSPATPGQSGFFENQVPQLLMAHAPRTGLTPNTGALPAHKSWGSFGPTGAAGTGEWRSAPMVSPLGAWLKIETAGQAGEPGVSLELHDAKTGAVLTTVRPDRVPGETWRAAYVRAPKQPFVLVAQDHDPARWIAFGAPIEVGNLSYLAWQLTKNGLLIVYLAGGAVAVLAVLALALPRSGISDRTA